MGIKTEDMVKGLPGKVMTPGVDWLGILDSFEPSFLDEKYINECARRNPFDTCYRWDTPARPVEERMRGSEWSAEKERRELEKAVERIRTEGLSPLTYKLARAALIKAIGVKGAMEYNRREYDRLGEEGRRKQAAEYAAWERARKEERAREEQGFETDGYYYPEYEPASVHEKIIRIRKGLKGSDGKPLTQRDFAKLLGYPINKYVEAEKVDRYKRRGEEESSVEDELLYRLIVIAHANPFWLFDPDCEAFYAEEDMTAESVLMGDEPCVYAAIDLILRWIKEGRPRITEWTEGIPRRLKKDRPF